MGQEVCICFLKHVPHAFVFDKRWYDYVVFGVRQYIQRLGSAMIILSEKSFGRGIGARALRLDMCLLNPPSPKREPQPTTPVQIGVLVGMNRRAGAPKID